MKKLVAMVLIPGAFALTLAGCTPGNNQAGATAAGAGLGAVAGGLLFHGDGQAAGIIGGAILGGIIGNRIGAHMDAQDKANMRSAIVNTPVNSQAQWTNNKTNVTYQVRPIRNYKSRGRYCREYQTRVKVGGKWKSAYGKACRKPDGSWHIVS